MRLPMEKTSQTAKKLSKLRTKTGWSWEKMAREFARVMQADGPTHTTLFRVASGTTIPQTLTCNYVLKAIEALKKEGK